jgi:hypothetical protein
MSLRQRNGELNRIRESCRHRRSVIDVEVKIIDSPATLTIPSTLNLPISSHRGVVGGFAQVVHKLFITEAYSCIHIRETSEVPKRLVRRKLTAAEVGNIRDMHVGVCEMEEKHVA